MIYYFFKIKVKGFKEDSQGKLSIIGALEVEARRRPHQKKKKYIKWNPAPDLLGRLLKYVVSVSDLIVQYKCPTTLENGNSKGKLCFIHITPKVKWNAIEIFTEEIFTSFSYMH